MNNLHKTLFVAVIMLLVAFIAVPQEYEFLPKSAVSVLNMEEHQKTETLTKKVWVTAYSSTPDQTDNTPFITASGLLVQDGLIAANFLPFGTVIKIPEFFDDKEFIVQDRMHRRKVDYVDIWMPSRNEALEFGRHRSEIIIVSSPENPVLARALLQ